MWQVESLFSERGRGLRASSIREAFKLAERPEVISFAGGFPDEAGFPHEILGRIAGNLATVDPRVFQYGPTEGLGELRSRIAGLAGELGIAAEPENILITNGSQQGLDLLGKVFLDPGDVVLVERPGYVGGLNAFQAYEASLVDVPMDRDGIDLTALTATLARLKREGRRVKLLYTVPCFQNPTGVVLSAERRPELVRLAREYGFLIIEDDPYRELYFGEAPPRPIASHDDGGGHVLYLGSFSKVFLPGIRVGWVIAPEPIFTKLAVAKQSADLCSNTLGQRLALEFVREGHLPAQAARVRVEYRRRRDTMVKALAEFMPDGTRWVVPNGGFFVWCTLPEGLDGTTLLKAALSEAVAFVPGDSFHAGGGGHNTLRLSYSQPPLERIPEGVRRLALVVARLAREQAGAPAVASPSVTASLAVPATASLPPAASAAGLTPIRKAVSL